MTAGAQHTIALQAPIGQDADLVRLQTVVHEQQQRLEQTHLSRSSARGSPILLLIDGREALAGTLTPVEQCQAVVSTNAALVALLNRYFNDTRGTGQPALTSPLQAARPEERLDWIAWEERKQRRLRHVNAGNQVA